MQFSIFTNRFTRAALVAFVLVLMASCVNSQPSAGHKTKADSTSAMAPVASDLFFKQLINLCGSRYVGTMTFPEDGQDDFAGKQLVADFAKCSDNEVRVPFSVGEDKSRTWIFSRLSNGIQLKHDHRHKDGTPDDINMYGGMALTPGTGLMQSFEADQHTATIIPAAATNVWNVSLSEDLEQLTYYLERHGKPRFKAELNLIK